MRKRLILGVLAIAFLCGQTCAPTPGTGGSTGGDTGGNTGGDTGGNTGGDTGGTVVITTGACDNGPQPVQTEHTLSVGSPTVTVIEYGDFQCPVCGVFGRDVFPTIRTKYVCTGKVKWIFRHFPLTAPLIQSTVHSFAIISAEASECANNQGSFWLYSDLLWTNQQALAALDPGPNASADVQAAQKAKAIELLRSEATLAGLDHSLFDPCLDGDSEFTRVQSDANKAIQANVSATPTFFINNTKVVGFKNVQQMSDLLDTALSGG